MRDNHHGAREGLEEALEPDDRFNIEVVGRLVQKENVILFQEELGQLYTHTPAPWEAIGQAREVLARKAQSREDALGVTFISITPMNFVLMSHIVQADK